ncbi:hypothetical protein AMTRI_Chr09g33200 [Amborella trichopoda]
MAEDGSEGSVATSSYTGNWWSMVTEAHNNNPLCNWASESPSLNPWRSSNPSSDKIDGANSSCEDEISTSFTNASNHSGLTIDSQELVESPIALSAEPTSENHLWNQVLLGVGANGEMQNGHDDCENLLDALSSQNLTTQIFEQGSDYAKKLENCWEFPNPTSFNPLEKHVGNYNGTLMEQERLNSTTDMVRNWSIAPPEQQKHQQFPTHSIDICDISLKSSSNQYSESAISQFQLSTGSKMKQEVPDLPALSSNRNSGLLPCLNDLVMEDNKFYSGFSDASWSNTRNFSDVIPFSGCLNKPLQDFQASKCSIKGTSSLDLKKQRNETSFVARGNGGECGILNEGKKRRPESHSDAVFKKPRNENSTVGSLKVQAPKVKVGDRITALQQIVSPFGKTDTASVLMEAIGYIKFLQEQVQLLSNPYMKSVASKQGDHKSWGGLEKKDKCDAKVDLKSRGLCLVPVACTPQVYRDNSGSDYWTPTYRGCLYR